MTLFHTDGHLTDEGLQALVDGTLNDIESLEVSEHLSFCDGCLLRYTDLLETTPLLAPETPLKEGVQRRIRLRGFRVVAGRTAKVAAAAVLAVGLWGGVSGGTLRPQGTKTETTSLSQQVNTAVTGLTGSLDQFFRQFGESGRPAKARRKERYRKSKEDVFTQPDNAVSPGSEPAE